MFTPKKNAAAASSPLNTQSQPSEQGDIALIHAALQGSTAAIIALLADERTDPNIQDKNGRTALIQAAYNGYNEAITALLADERVDPNIQDKNGASALLAAAHKGHPAAITALLADERVDPNIQDKNGASALMHAVCKGHNEALTALLANKRTDPNVKNTAGYTALMLATTFGYTAAITALLANECTDLNIQNENGHTALIVAANHGHTAAVTALLTDERVDPNIKDENGASALIYAVCKGHNEALTALLDDKRTAPNIQNNDGRTALIIAATHGHTAATTALLAAERIDPNIQDANGCSALMLTAGNGHTAVIKALLADERTDPNIQDDNSSTALIFAASKGHTAAIAALLHDKRTEPNIQDISGNTALMYATHMGHIQAVKALLTDKRINPTIANNQGGIALNYVTNAKYGAIAEILMHDDRFIGQLNAENIGFVLSNQPSTKILKTIISTHPSLTFSILLDNNINMRSRTVLLQHCKKIDYFAADTPKCAALIGLINQNSALFDHKKMPACFKPKVPENLNHLLKLTQLFRLESLAELEHLLQSCSPILKQQSIGFLAQLRDADKAALIDYIHDWHHIFNSIKTFAANSTLLGQDHDATISQCVNAEPNRDWAVVLEPHQQFQTLQDANRHADLGKDVAIFLTHLERSFYVKAYGLDLDATAFTAAVQAHYHTLKTKVQQVGENIQSKYRYFSTKILEGLKKQLQKNYPIFIRNHQDKITYTIGREEQQLYYQLAHLDPENSKIADINTYLKQYPLQLPDKAPIAKALTNSGSISAALSLYKALNDPEDLAAIMGEKTLSCLSLCYKHCNGKELPVTVADLQGLLQDLQNNAKMTKSSCLFWSFRENEPSPLQKHGLFKPTVTTAITPTAAKAITANAQTDHNGETTAEGSREDTYSTVVPSALVKAAPTHGSSIKKASLRIEPNITISSRELMATVSGSSGGHRQENQSIAPASAYPSPSVINVANSIAQSTTAKEGSVSLQALEIIAHSLPARINSTRRFIQESTGCLPAAADEDVATATKQQQQHCCTILEDYLRKIYNQYYQHIDARSTEIDAPATTKTAQLYTGANALLEEFQQFQVSRDNDGIIKTYYLSAIGADIEYLICDLITLNQAKAYIKTANKTNIALGSTATKPSHGFTVHEHCRSANPLWLALKCDIQALRNHSFAQLNPNWAKFIGSIYGQVRSLRKSLPPGQSQLQQSLQHDFCAQANSLLYYLDFEECIDEQTAVGKVIQNTLGRYNSSRHQCQLSTHNHYRYQRNHNILETALTASTLADQPTPVDALFLAFAWHDLQKSYLSEHNIKFSTVLANYGGPCHAIKIIKKLRNDFAHSAEILEQNMTSVAALTAWINQQYARIDTGTYAKHLTNHPDPDQQLKCLLGDALTQYSQLVTAVVPIAAEPRPMPKI